MFHILSNQKNCPSNWGKQLKKSPLYIASSFAITIAGVLMFLNKKYNKNTIYCIISTGLIIMGIISFLSDIRFVDKKHWIHCIDRLFAFIGVIIITIFIFYTPKSKFVICMATILLFISVSFHICGKMAILQNNFKSYRTNHTLWHFMICILVLSPLLYTET